mmetsp:Transcript_9181/g.15472  ORF Transcript_9181/g.15472 Transcript_9181/m.15472 type:complete len:371 (+) Transcript_9181:161-1273(+)
MRGHTFILTAVCVLTIYCGVQYLVSSFKSRVSTVHPPIVYAKLPPTPGIKPRHFICKDDESCFAMHMNNPGFKLVMRDRCNIGNISHLATRNLTFTHIPKCGGSSLRHLLRKHFSSRFQRIGPGLGPHVPFFLSQKKNPANIFFTVMREPTALAISLYNYVNMHKTMPKHLYHDKFWMSTYNRDPIEWTKDKFVRKTLRNQVLRFFTWYSKAAKSGHIDGRGDFANPHVWREFLRLPETYNTVMDPWVPLSSPLQQDFINYTQSIPSEYQCTSELKVALILIQRYSAIGVMENYQQFFHILHKRAVLEDVAFDALMVDSSEKKNPSTNKISAAKIKIVTSNLKGLFFCSRVLWKIAFRISDYDSACYGGL